MAAPPDRSSEPTIQQLFDLSGRTALVTGATGYLGASMARALAEAGAKVVVGSRDAAKASAFARELPNGHQAGHLGVALDQLNFDDLSRQFDQIVDQAGPIDVLVNNGHEAQPSDWSQVQAAEFNRQLSNATAYFELARLVRDRAVARGAPASVIQLGSMYGLVASYPDAYAGVTAASPVAYHTLKGGILQMTRHLAAYWAADRVRVNSLSPGPFPPPRVSTELVQRLSAKLPMQRMGQPHELKGAVLFLASDASSFVTGQNLVVDGGWTAW